MSGTLVKSMEQARTSLIECRRHFDPATQPKAYQACTNAIQDIEWAVERHELENSKLEGPEF